MKKHILFATFMAALLTLAVFGFGKGGARPGGAPPKAQAAQAGSLREKARGSSGRHVVFATPNGVKRFNDVAALAGQSTLVVTGVVEGASSRFDSPAENAIVTDFRVRIKDVLKGEAVPEEYIVVREPGGVVEFGDGTSAEVKMPDYWRSPEVGKTYAFFLKRKGGVHLLFGGPQGLFELSGAGGVLPQTLEGDALTQRYRGRKSADFIEEVRQAAGPR